MAAHIPKTFQKNIAFISSYEATRFSMYVCTHGTLKFYSTTRLWTPNPDDQQRIAAVFHETVNHIVNRFDTAPAAETHFTLLISSVIIDGFARIANDYWMYPTIYTSAGKEGDRLEELCHRVNNMAKEKLDIVMDPESDESDPLNLLTIGFSIFELEIVKTLLARKYGEDVERFVSKYTDIPADATTVNRDLLVRMIRLAEGCTYRLGEAQRVGMGEHYQEAVSTIQKLGEKVEAKDKALHLLNQQVADLKAQLETYSERIPPPPIIEISPPPLPPRAASSSSASPELTHSSSLLSDIRRFSGKGQRLRPLSIHREKTRQPTPLEGLPALLQCAVDDFVKEKIKQRFEHANGSSSDDDTDWE